MCFGFGRVDATMYVLSAWVQSGEGVEEVEVWVVVVLGGYMGVVEWLESMEDEMVSVFLKEGNIEGEKN